MAEMVLTNAYLLLNSVDLSSKVRSLSLKYSGEMHDITAMGDTTQNRLSGLMDWSVDVEFNQDYAAGSVDATIFPLIGGASVAIQINPNTSSTSTTNPKFTGSVLVSAYNPVAGKVGDVAIATVTLMGTGALTRATS